MMCHWCQKLADKEKNTGRHEDHMKWCTQPITCTCQHRPQSKGYVREGDK